MAKKEANTNCILCGKPYHLCIICESTKPDWKRWKTITDTENCYNIYVVLNDYNFGNITKEKAFELLSKFDLSDLENFKESTKNIIKDILSVKTVNTEVEAVNNTKTTKSIYNKKQDD